MNGDNCNKNACKYNLNNQCYNIGKCLHPPSFHLEKDKKSIGNVGERCTGFTKQEIKAYELHKKGWSFMRISKELKCSKSMAYKRVNKVKALYKGLKGVGKVNGKPLVKKVNGVRLHNDCFSFLIHPISFWGEPNIVKLKNISYLLVKRKGLHIQIFPNKLVVRFLDDVVCSSVDLCLLEAGDRVVNFLKSFKYRGVRFLGERFEQVSRHYALLDNCLAMKYVREKRKFLVRDKDDGKTRLVVDYSNNTPEFEAEHAVKSSGDASKTEAYFQDLIDRDNYMPSTTKIILDTVLYTHKEYAENLKEHLAVMRVIKDFIKKDKK